MELEWPSLLIPLLSFLLFLLIFLKSQPISKSAQSYSRIPGPKKLPFIGNLHQMLATPNLHHLFRDLGAKYGPLMHLQLGELHFLIVSSLEISKQLLTTHDINFANRPPNLSAEILGYNYSEIVFAPYGDYWRQAKKLLTLELLSAKRVRSFRHTRDEKNRNLVKWIASCEGSPANLTERVYMASYDVITTVSVGGITRDRETVIPVIQEATKLAAGFSIAELYPSIKCLPSITGIRYKYQQMFRRIDKVLGNIIEQHRGSAKDDDAVEDLVNVLLKHQEDGSENPLTDDNIKGLLLSIIVAGSDTSATVVEWAMSEMIRNPSILKKAQDEVRKVFDGDKGYVYEEKFHELEYLKLVIKETLRLHPPAPLLVPRVNTQTCVIDGYEIPAKTRVIINAWALGRDPKYWGDDADNFIPERFGDLGMDYKGNNYEFLPFGSGRRACPGISFGVSNVEFTLATLLYHFDWKMPIGMKNEDLDMIEEFGATVARKHHLHLIPTVTRPLND